MMKIQFVCSYPCHIEKQKGNLSTFFYDEYGLLNVLDQLPTSGLPIQSRWRSHMFCHCSCVVILCNYFRKRNILENEFKNMLNALRHLWNFVERGHCQTPPRMQQLLATFHIRKSTKRTLTVLFEECWEKNKSWHSGSIYGKNLGKAGRPPSSAAKSQGKLRGRAENGMQACGHICMDRRWEQTGILRYTPHL